MEAGVSVECQCPGCGRKYLLSDNMAGERVQCVQCGAVFDMPETTLLSLDATTLGEPVARRWYRSAAFRLGVPVGAVVVLSGLILAAILVPAARRARLERNEEIRERNVRRIAKALVAYAREHGERLPQDQRGALHSLALLYPGYLNDPDAFLVPEAAVAGAAGDTFPQDTELGGRMCSYLYLPPGAAGWPEANRIVLTERAELDPRRQYVVYADGRVGWRETVPQED